MPVPQLHNMLSFYTQHHTELIIPAFDIALHVVVYLVEQIWI
jgi:hypothetical protein